MLRKVKSRKDVLIAIGGALTILLVLDLTPLGGNVLFYAKWVQCGQRPLYTQKGAGFESGVPSYVSSSSFGFLRGFMPYYCSPRDAELAGYSADRLRYDFPHLKTQEEKLDAYSKAQKILTE